MEDKKYHDGFPTTRSTLIERVASGDDAAKGVFFSLYYEPVKKLGMRLGLSPEDAEELATNVLIEVSVKLKPKEADSVRAVIRTRTRERAIDHHRRKKPNTDLSGDLSSYESGEVAPDEEFDQHVVRNLINRAKDIVREGRPLIDEWEEWVFRNGTRKMASEEWERLMKVSGKSAEATRKELERLGSKMQSALAEVVSELFPSDVENRQQRIADELKALGRIYGKR